MNDAEARNELELTLIRIFEGLHAGLSSFGQVRDAYNEQVAFDFNSTSFFRPGEVKISEILAFFLHPNKPHGQKSAFLRIFVEELKPKNCSLPLFEAPATITAEVEDTTAEGRRIDIVISFRGNDRDIEYVIGVENKIGTAADGRSQLRDYVRDLRARVRGDDKQWTLFYLTPYGSEPPEHSISKGELVELRDSANMQMISYRRIVDLLGMFEAASKAESVRAFLRDFKQYLKKEIVEEPSMNDETNWIKSFLREHPGYLAHTDGLQDAIDSLKKDYFDFFWRTVAELLPSHELAFGRRSLEWGAKQYGSADIVTSTGASVFADASDLDGAVLVWKDPRAPTKGAYVCTRLRKQLDDPLEVKLKRLETQLQSAFKSVFRPTGPHCAGVLLTHPEFDSGTALREFLGDDGTKARRAAATAATVISEYVREVEKAWSESDRVKASALPALPPGAG
jgi:hypothetical protein